MGRRARDQMKTVEHTFCFSDQSLRRLAERHGLAVERRLVCTPTPAEKLPGYRFRRWNSRLALYGLHSADVWTGRGGRVMVWCRKPDASATATTPCWSS